MFNHTKIIIPDKAILEGAPNMWGIYRGDGKLHQFYCSDCYIHIEVKFPRWDRTLNKERVVDDVLNNKIFRCPGCINSNFIEVN